MALLMNQIQNWIKQRLTERTTVDGLVLIAAGIGFLVFKPLASIIAYTAIVYGILTVIRKD